MWLFQKSIAVSLLSATVHSFSGVIPNTQRVFVSTPAKPNARSVKDCMAPVPSVLSPSMSVDEAISTLLHLGYSGAPVVDDVSGELIGMVSAFDFLQKEAGGALLPMEGTVEEIEAMAEAAQKIVATSVRDLMTFHRVVTITPDDSMREAAALMTKERLHRLPVVDKDTGKLVGMLSSSDAMRDVLTTVRMSLPDHDHATVPDGTK
jgi:CBS domain-containing protein